MTKFKLAYIDAPWKFNARNNPDTKFGSGMSAYHGMSESEITNVYVQLETLMDDNCAIISWAVNPKLDQYFHIMDHMKEYGFRHVTKLFSWIKISKNGAERKLPGFYTLSNTEDCYLMLRGSMNPDKKGIGQIIVNTGEVFYGECLKPHSTKPKEVRDKIVELFGDVPRIELFARSVPKTQDGWVNVGNEVIGTEGLDIVDALKMVKEDKYL